MQQQQFNIDFSQTTDEVCEKCGNDNDQCLSGILKLYNPLCLD